jgi:beta-N-acetylhexosaminidase
MVKTLPIVAGLLCLGAVALTRAWSLPEPDPIVSGIKLGQMLAPSKSEPALLDLKIGQMIMVGFPGDNERDNGVKMVREQLAEGVIGGVALFPDNIRSPRQLRWLIAYLRNARSKPKPFIAVDQEGGKVQRLRRGNGHGFYPSARSVALSPSYSSPDSVHRLYAKMAHELADAGFNMNFGPVVDLNRNPRNPVIAGLKRSYGSDPHIVTAKARAFILAHREANIITVAKHFPGHGSSLADSHKILADVSQSWREVELEPYRTLAKEGLLDAVMIGHLYHPRFSDGGRLPSSLSAKAVRALRTPSWLGFRGVVISDDMAMGAVGKTYSLEERVIKSISAGTDIFLYSNVKRRDPEIGVKIHAIIARAVADGRISPARIEQSYGRIMLLKRRLAQKDLAGKW